MYVMKTTQRQAEWLGRHEARLGAAIDFILFHIYSLHFGEYIHKYRGSGRFQTEKKKSLWYLRRDPPPTTMASHFHSNI